MRDTTSKARERTKDTVQVVGHKIEERPFTSLIITFVVGRSARRCRRAAARNQERRR